LRANFKKEGRAGVFGTRFSAMALPNLDEVLGTDRVSDDEFEFSNDLTGNDGYYRF